MAKCFRLSFVQKVGSDDVHREGGGLATQDFGSCYKRRQNSWVVWTQVYLVCTVCGQVVPLLQ